MEGLDVDTSNDIAVEKSKDFKRVIIKSIDKFNSYIKLDTKIKISKRKILKRKITEKKDTVKEYFEKINTKKITSNMMLKIIINQILN